MLRNGMKSEELLLWEAELAVKNFPSQKAKRAMTVVRRGSESSLL